MTKALRLRIMFAGCRGAIMFKWEAGKQKEIAVQSVAICALNPVGLLDNIGKCKSHALSRTPSYCRTSPRDKASVPFGMTGILSRRAFRNELFKEFQQISLHKPLVYFLGLRDTLL